MLKADLYLKTVLTVIAVCLTLLTLNTFGWVPTAQANAAAMLPSASGTSAPTTYGLVPVNPDGTISVRMVRGELMDVNVKQVDGRNLFNNSIPVDIRAVDGTSVFNGAVPVQNR